MNKQEAIERLYQKCWENSKEDDPIIYVSDAINIISQIDEPQKVVIPKFVAEWLEDCKSRNLSLGQAIETVNSKQQEEVFEWFWDTGFRDNQFQFARAWLDGYEVEKEKLCTVEIPNPNSVYPMVLYKNDDGGVILGTCYTPDNWEKLESNQLTESEIKEDFEWAWQWAKPVED